MVALGQEQRMTNIDKVLKIATVAHLGQVDKLGEPYIMHPLRIMLRMDSVEAKMTAMLHDVVEDTDVTLDDLRLAARARGKESADDVGFRVARWLGGY